MIKKRDHFGALLAFEPILQPHSFELISREATCILCLCFCIWQSYQSYITTKDSQKRFRNMQATINDLTHRINTALNPPPAPPVTEEGK